MAVGRIKVSVIDRKEIKQKGVGAGMEEKVTVIIPTYNRAHLIKRSVESVLNQTYQDIQILVIDDGSGDDTQQVVQGIEDARITYYRKEKNEGVSLARNTGVELAQTDYIAFQDSDDVWRPDKLQKQMQKMKSEDVAMVYCPFAYHGMEQLELLIPDEERPIEALEGNVFLQLLKGNFISTQTMLLKKDAFESVGGFDSGFPCLEDYDFVLRFAKKYPVGIVREPLVDVYAQTHSLTNNVAAELVARCLLVGKHKQDLLDSKCFDHQVNYIIENAQRNNCLEQIVAYLEQVLKSC